MERGFKARQPHAFNAYKDGDENQLSFGASNTLNSGTAPKPPFSYHDAKKPQSYSKPNVPGIPNNLRLLSQPRSSLLPSMPVSTSDPQRQRVRQVAPTKRQNVIPFNPNTSLPSKFEAREIPNFHHPTSNFSDEFSPNEYSSPVRNTDNSNFQLYSHSLGDRTLVLGDPKTLEEAKCVVKGSEEESGSNNSREGLLTPPKAFIPAHFGASATAKYHAHPRSGPESDYGIDLSHSRGRPVVRSITQQLPLPEAGEDYDDMMLRAAFSQHKIIRAEHGEQRKEIEYLRAELEATKKEKMELSKRLEVNKVAATKALEASKKNMNGLQADLQALKSQADKRSASVTEVRSNASEITLMRENIAENLKQLGPLLDENCVFRNGTAVRTVVAELQQEYGKSQEVVSILREKLHVCGSDLIEARNRVTELESLHISEKKTFNASVDRLYECGEKIFDVSTSLSAQKQEYMETLIHNADMERKLSAANKLLVDQGKEVAEKESQLKTARSFHQKNIAMQSQLDEKNSKLESIRQELSNYIKTAREQEVQLGISRASIAELTNRVENFEGQLRQAEEATTQTKLSEQAAWVKNAEALERIHFLAKERDQVRQNLENQYALGKQDEARYQALQDRCEAQTIELRVTRDSNAELKNRLNDISQTMKCEVAVLEEQKAALQIRFEDLTNSYVAAEMCLTEGKSLQDQMKGVQEKLRTAEESAKGLLAETCVLKEQRTALQERLDARSSTAHSASKTVKELQDRLEVNTHAIGVLQGRFNDQSELLRTEQSSNSASRERFENTIQKLHCDIAVLQSEKAESQAALRKAEASFLESTQTAILLRERFAAELKLNKGPQEQQTSAQVEELRALRQKVVELEEMNARLEHRASTISARHKAGNLTDSEKVFVNSVIQMLKDIHEQELVAKSNELRRRENTIKGLQSRVGGLEMSLARHLKARENELAAQGVQLDSMIDLNSWVSKDSSSSPTGSRQGGAASNFETASAPPLGAPSRALNLPNRDQGKTKHDQATTRMGPPVSTAPQGKPRDGPSFAKLNLEDSDDIGDFDDGRMIQASTELGKRDRIDSPGKGEQNEAGRPTRRLRGATRKPDEHGEPSGSKKQTKDVAVKTKQSRRR